MVQVNYATTCVGASTFMGDFTKNYMLKEYSNRQLYAEYINGDRIIQETCYFLELSRIRSLKSNFNKMIIGLRNT